MKRYNITCHITGGYTFIRSNFTCEVSISSQSVYIITTPDKKTHYLPITFTIVEEL